MEIIEITENEYTDIMGHICKGVKCMNKAIECLEDMKDRRNTREHDEYHDEERRNRRRRYDDDYEDDEYEDDDEDVEERKRHDSRKKHSSYRYGRY